MRARFAGLVLVAVAATVLAPSGTSWAAGGSADGACGSDDCGVIVATGGTIQRTGDTPYQGSTSSSPVTCIYVDSFGPVDTSALKDGDVIQVSCYDPGTGEQISLTDLVWPPAQVIPQPSAADLAQVAIGRMSVPMPAVRTWPPAGRPGLVNLPVILHVDNWAPLTAAATAGGLTATVTATPVRVVWNMDEDVTTCHDGGSVWYDGASPSDMSCTYTYARSSGSRENQTYGCHATIVWHVAWAATNGQGADLGELQRTTAFGTQIQESQTVIGAPPTSAQGG